MNNKYNKNQSLYVKCDSIGNNFEGISHIDGYTFFINDFLPNENAYINLEKCNKTYSYAKITKRINNSDLRIDPYCKYYKQCGGCSCQHIKYKETLKIKSELVKNCFKKYSNIDIDVPETIGSENPWYSRNKISLPVRDINGNINIGFYKKRSHNIVEITECPVSKIIISNIISSLKEWMYKYKISAYNENENTGKIKHIVLKNNYKDDIMIILVTTSKKTNNIDELINLWSKNLNINSIYLNINSKKTNVILGDENILIYGKKYINQKYSNYEFQISPNSFMQVNNTLSSVLYEKAIELSDIKNIDLCVDAYCGIGTLSIILSKYAKRVIGIEVIKDAIENATNNAILNNVNNIEFICDKVENFLPIIVKKEKIDLLFLDPPRKGIDISIIESIKKSIPQKITYISCNPSTQARDVKYLLDLGYCIKHIQPVDMFCMTSEIENIVVLEKLN